VNVYSYQPAISKKA